VAWMTIPTSEQPKAAVSRTLVRGSNLGRRDIANAPAANRYSKRIVI